MSKRKHFSKALTILLAVVMVFTMVPAMAWADGGGSGVSPEAGQGQAPTSVTVQYEGLPVLDGKIIAKHSTAHYRTNAKWKGKARFICNTHRNWSQSRNRSAGGTH